MYFSVELNNVRHRRNNVVIFNVDFDNVGQRRNNSANMTISKKKKKPQKQNNIFELQGICWTQNLQFFSILKGIFAEPQKFLKYRIYETRKLQCESTQ